MFYIYSVLFTFIVCFFAFIVTLYNLYLYLRRLFPAKVNCWFCNTWTKVDYDNQNSFECPTCLQYNGFTKDGSYNRYMPEQHDEQLNQYQYTKKRSPVRNLSNNRLCATCNYNQELKVSQLANFVPLVEENYDVEVEHFQKQLEKAYGLCKRCNNVLTNILQDWNLKIFGNRIRQLNKKTCSLFDLNKSYNGISKMPLFIKFIHYSVVVFAALLFINTATTFNYSDVHMRKLLPHFVFHTIDRIKQIFTDTQLQNTEEFNYVATKVDILIIQTLSKYCDTFFEETMHFWETLNKQYFIALRETITIPNIQPNEHYTLTAISGLLLQLIFCFWTKNKNLINASQITSWIILILISVNRSVGRYGLLKLFFEVFCPLLIMYTMTYSASQAYVEKKSKKKLCNKKLIKEDSVFSAEDNSETNTYRKNTFSSSIKNAYCDNLKNVTANKSDYVLSSHNTLETELNTGLSNLALSPSNHKINVPKPLLSPSKLNSATKNPWTAGGFWNHPYNFSPASGDSNLSRSSSCSSGFGSHANDNVQSNSFAPTHSVFGGGGDDQFSVFSEPPYQLGSGQFEFYKTRDNITATAFYSSNSRFAVQNPRPVLWNNYGRGSNCFMHRSTNKIDKFHTLN